MDSYKLLTRFFRKGSTGFTFCKISWKAIRDNFLPMCCPWSRGMKKMEDLIKEWHFQNFGTWAGGEVPCLQETLSWLITVFLVKELVVFAFQSQSTLCSCQNVKELLALNRCDIWNLSDRNVIVSSNPAAALHRNHFSYVTNLTISQYHFSLFIFAIFVSTKLQVIFKSHIKL